MAWSNPDFIKIPDLYLAYRKAKREAFVDANCAYGLRFAEFEANLEHNIQSLCTRLNRAAPSWQRSPSFLGATALITKSVDAVHPARYNDQIHINSGDNLENWNREHANGVRYEATFRTIIDASVEFMTISALWILKVGHKFDASLDTRFAVGNRLRRWRAPQEAPLGRPGSLNQLCHTLFEHYPTAYASWRRRGLISMRTEMEAGRQIVAVTMDLKSFYHRVDASFLLSEDFLATCRVTLDPDEREFTNQLVRAIRTWNHSAGQKVGVPVGLTASAVIANVLLRDFDQAVLDGINPVYYGRYVDDVFLVFRRTRDFNDGTEVLSWIANRLGQLAQYFESHPDNPDDGPLMQLNLVYAPTSTLQFVGKKQKIFLLDGPSGIDLIAPIEEHIRRQSSEHRRLPDVPDSESEMAARALLVTPDATLDADALRKADKVTLRRAGFAMLLRDIEAHTRDLESSSWRELRMAFYGLADRQLLTPQGFFDYPKYFPRILGIMISCSDWESAVEFLAKLHRVTDTLRRTCGEDDGDINASLNSCCANLSARLLEAALKASPQSRSLTMARRVTQRLQNLSEDQRELQTSSSSFRDAVLSLERLDWSREPYAPGWIAAQEEVASIPNEPASPDVRALLPFEAIENFRTAAQLTAPYWPALAFPTRPISTNLITISAPSLLGHYETLRSVVMGLRGCWMPTSTSLNLTTPDGEPTLVTVPYRTGLLGRASRAGSRTIAVANFETTQAEWEAAVDQNPVLSLLRYRRLNRLINTAIGSTPHPQYLLLPECSVPRKWALPLTTKANINRISVIAGLEYRRTSQGLHNEALVALTSTFSGYHASVCFTQSKRAPAWAEQTHVRQQVGLSVVASNRLDRPVINHGGFCFGVLICSDLTDMQNRAHFRGNVDCLFIPEWNSDLDSFSALVESAALDLHCYIVQANNRLFGDGRIRGPYRTAHRRDIVRIRGGLHDYVVVGEVDFESLRVFQSNVSPPQGPDETFKPFPIGFSISRLRRVNRSMAERPTS